MRDFEHRRCIEDVFCPHAPLRVFTKCKRSRFVKVRGFFTKCKRSRYVKVRGFFTKCKRSRYVKAGGFLYALPLPSIVAISTSESSDLSTRVFDTLFAPWFSQSPTLQPFEAYFFVKFLFFLCTLLYSCGIIDIYIYISYRRIYCYVYMYNR